ncbi:hypothetical protein BLA17378_03472 [Burkholderia aenigmatica]|uniref:Lipoprotein n=1 Tax=Burkholderia aenigmatica TaxID=2015348 RepID=A0ABY6XXJ4_9BURK|nr:MULTISPECIES: hypothetical protein [Burkholderia]VWC74040.1 hypothetical protein BLA17378_03472 [Burkholderia aenigmatica]VWD59850.1 hypothetical protein BLA18628_07074 [Burkholderia aenigmatica]
MKLEWLAMGVLLILGACASDERMATFRQSETQLLKLRQIASLPCATQAACDHAWQLTQRYVENRSSTRITRFDAEVIETAQPHLAGNVYLWASRVALSRGGWLIRIKAMCKGMYSSDGGPGWRYDVCVAQILEIEGGFQSFVIPLSDPEATGISPG